MEKAGKRFIVTGGAGFLGSQLVRHLLPFAEKIEVIDDLSTGDAKQLPKSSKISFHKGDFFDEKLLSEVLPEVEVLYHLACRNLVQSVEYPKVDFKVNLEGGFRLLEFVREKGKHLKRIVYTSTASVYGNAGKIPTSEEALKPNLPYAASKLAMEHYCEVYHQLYHLPIAILRLSNVYGPGQTSANPYAGVVSKFFEALRNGEALTIYGDGNQTRDFTYVEDVMELLLRAGQEERFVGRIYNVATGVETTIRHLADLVREVAGKPDHPVQYARKRQVDRVDRRCLDLDRIRKETGWEPVTSLKEGLKKTYAWFLKDQDERTGAEEASFPNGKSGESGRRIGAFAVIEEGVLLGEEVHIGAFAVIEKGARIGRGCRIGNHAVIGAGSILGENVEVGDFSLIGRRPSSGKKMARKPMGEGKPAVLQDGVRIGVGAVIYQDVLLEKDVFVGDYANIREKVEVGERSVIGRNVMVELNCKIGRDVTIQTGSYITGDMTVEDEVFIGPSLSSSNDKYMGRGDYPHRGPTIKRGAKIGNNATLLPGIVIGEGAMIGAGAVVTKDVGAGMTMVGNPAHPIRK